MFKNVALPAIIVFFLLALNVQAFFYDITYYDTSSAGTSLTTNPVQFHSDEVTSIEMNQRIDFQFNDSANSGSYNANYLSPYSNTVAISSATLTQNYSCLNLGSTSVSYTANEAEGRSTMTHDGDATSRITTGNRYQTTNSRYLTINQEENDTEGFLSNMVFLNVCDGAGLVDSTITGYLDEDSYGLCKVNQPKRTKYTYESCGTGIPKYYAYTIFNSSTGNVSYSSRTPDSTGQTRHVLYAFDDTSTIIEGCTNLITCTKTVTLDENRLYVLAATAQVNDAGVDETPTINITIDTAIADYSCPAYSDCDPVTSTQTRECVDLNGLQPNRVDILACDLTVLQNASLGFEDFTTSGDILKCEPAFGLFCNPYTIVNISNDLPTNWTVINPNFWGSNFLRMTSEYATQGTRSLKMWSIPPKEGEVISNDTCGNLTSAKIPTVFQNISNTSFSVSHNVTFPSTNMQIGWDARACDSPELQHSDVGGVLWSNISGERIYVVPPFCYERCYGNDCNEQPRGDYVFNLIDTTTDLSVFGNPLYLSAEANRTDRRLISLNDLGLVVGRNYRMLFAGTSENVNDATSNCIYLDNVRYQVTQESIEALAPNCESRCLGTTRVEAFLTNEGSCFISQTQYSPLCVGSSAIADELEAGVDVCDPDDNTTLLSFNEMSGLYEETDCDFQCINGRCSTETEATQATTEATLYDCVLGSACSGFGSLGFFLSIFMIVNYIAILAGVLVLIVTKAENWIFSGITTLIIILGAFGAGVYPVEIGVTIIVLIGLSAAIYFGKQFTGGG